MNFEISFLTGIALNNATSEIEKWFIVRYLWVALRTLSMATAYELMGGELARDEIHSFYSYSTCDLRD